MFGFFEGFAGKVVVAGAGFAVGGFAEWIRSKLKRRRERIEVEKGHRFKTIDFKYLFVSQREDKHRLHVESLGSLPLDLWLPVEYTREALIHRAASTGTHESVVPMQGSLGSFVLEELHGLVCMIAPKAGYANHRWVLVPVFETYTTLDISTPTVLLVRLDDLKYFGNFAKCRDLQVLYGSDGAKILTTMEIERKFRAQCERFVKARSEGRTTRHLEEMWVINLGLNTQVEDPLPELVESGVQRPWRNVPWERYAAELSALGYQS